jgi:DNA-binding transcriptional LysR family regulator
LEIHRTGSVTQAAKNLFVTQSSVSIALSALEKELGFPIFIRSKKGLTPTPRGATII